MYIERVGTKRSTFDTIQMKKLWQKLQYYARKSLPAETGAKMVRFSEQNTNFLSSF